VDGPTDRSGWGFNAGATLIIYAGGRGGERGRGRGEGRGGRGGFTRARRNSDAGEEGAGGEGGDGNPAEKKERPRLQLKPRSKPLEAKEAEDASARKPSIFGGGKPHDELEWTVRCAA
jgi:hypothetical protein